MSSYQEDADTYRDEAFRVRAEMCIREQGYAFVSDPRAEVAALGRGVVGGNWADIDAVMAATASYSAHGDLSDDAALLSSVQTVWPTVAGARYPQ